MAALLQPPPGSDSGATPALRAAIMNRQSTGSACHSVAEASHSGSGANEDEDVETLQTAAGSAGLSTLDVRLQAR